MDSNRKVTRRALQERAREMARKIGHSIGYDPYPVVLAALIRGHQDKGIAIVEERPALQAPD